MSVFSSRSCKLEMTPEKWAEEAFDCWANKDYSCCSFNSFKFVEWSDCKGAEEEASFIRMTLLADWISYAPPLYSVADRCEYDRMRRVILSYPEGFRLLVLCDGTGEIVPLGYSGWYSISKECFQQLENCPDAFTHRGQIEVEKQSLDTDNFFYIFNISVHQSLRHTPLTSSLLRNMNKSMEKHTIAGLAAVTVAEDGARVMTRYGMKCTGSMTHMGEAESVFVVRFNPPVKLLKLHPKQKPLHL